MVAHASGNAGEVRADGKAPGAGGSAAADFAPRKRPRARMGSRPESLVRGASRLVEDYSWRAFSASASCSAMSLAFSAMVPSESSSA